VGEFSQRSNHVKLLDTDSIVQLPFNSKGYAPAIADIWGREQGGGVGEALAKLKIPYHYFAIYDVQKPVVCCISFKYLIFYSPGLCEPEFTF